MKLDHWQGRAPAKQSADEDTFAEFMLRFACVIAFAAVLASVPAWGQTNTMGTVTGNTGIIVQWPCTKNKDGECLSAKDFVSHWINPPELDAQIKALEKRIAALEKRNADADEAARKQREAYDKMCPPIPGSDLRMCWNSYITPMVPK